MLTFENENGKVMCLRPDLTASCVKYLGGQGQNQKYIQAKLTEDQVKGHDFINDQLGIEILGSKNQTQYDFSNQNYFEFCKKNKNIRKL